MINNQLAVNLFAFFSGFILVLLLTPLIAKLAKKFNIIDRPGTAARKIHDQPIPLLGGLAIFLAFFLGLAIFRFGQLANFSRVPDSYLLIIFVASLLIMLGGFLDDKYGLKPSRQIIWPLLAALLVVSAGVKISFITNPLGGADNLILYLSPILGSVLAFFWLMGMMYTTKFLDGLDGLAVGIGAIASIMIFLVSLKWDVPLSITGVGGLILFGSTLGFLIFNFQPAKIFLGEGGSIFLGFILGVLSILSGSKISTTLLVVGLPAVDVLWVTIQRLLLHQSPFSHADRKHLHFQLLTAGFSRREAVLLLYLIALSFGAIGLMVGSFGKLISLMLLLAVMVMIVLSIAWRKKKYGGQFLD